MSELQRIYLDNAATSWPKSKAVDDPVDDYQRRLGAAAGVAEVEDAATAFNGFRPVELVMSADHETNTARQQGADITAIPGLQDLWKQTLGDPNVCIAVLDGPVDLSHPCFEGANLSTLPSIVPSDPDGGPASQHGTHVASVIFGRHNPPLKGIAPTCRGLIIPIFKDGANGSITPCSQLDLARAIVQAVERGAHVINVSGGQFSPFATAHPILADAVGSCARSNVLIVAAAGNEGCDCLHVPGALPSVLAVGAMNEQGEPLDFSNWGRKYREQGILAPGENILGAVPGRGTVMHSGTSFATPIVSGAAALLLSLQWKVEHKSDPRAVRHAILQSALGCEHQKVPDCRRLLVGRLNIRGALPLVNQGANTMADHVERQVNIQSPDPHNSPVSGAMENSSYGIQAAACDVAKQGGSVTRSQTPDEDEDTDNFVDPQVVQTVEPYGQRPSANRRESVGTSQAPHEDEGADENGAPPTNQAVGTYGARLAANRGESAGAPSSVRALASNSLYPAACSCGSGGPPQLVYALGSLSYDFGTQARFDGIALEAGRSSPPFPPNIGTSDLVDHFTETPHAATSVIWTLNDDATPIYVIRPDGPFARETYAELVKYLGDQIDPDQLAERVSLPGYIMGSETNGTVGWCVRS